MQSVHQVARRGRRLSFDRDEALEIALRLFWARGYEGTSVADLVRAIGIAPPSLYKAFGGKEQLYREALELYRRNYASFVADALQLEQTALRSVERLLFAAAATYCDPALPTGCMVSTAALSCAPEHDTIVRLVADMRHQTILALTHRFDRAKETGDLPGGTDTTALSRYFVAIIQGMSVQSRDGATSDELRDIARIAMLAFPTS
ncbi:hypothetical protein XarzCFBP7410_05525 [Xanthomonas arboricola pv. zantedeschiae]|uniref:TetR/AcrR family transcriptional regulator n=1 Tax=Xanthomonas arboricola TaxID=56448 RepID=UPI000CEDFD01|nr:TetR/AcrR family transcriptional regulator [Xanthomonas arboricola]PPT84740.1 hypothetical protein XarzCFBP7410_05525 [Xanthomonas arboricola pv. zantedeschiae]